MPRFKVSTLFILFISILEFHKNDISCEADDDDGSLNIIPDCIMGANEVDFYLWNSRVPDGIIVDNESDDIPIAQSSKYIRILIHGFTSEANNTDYKYLIGTWLNKSSDVNIFSVNWKEGACTGGLSIFQLLSYPEAISNTWEVAMKIGDFIRKLMETNNLKLEDFGVIGHSLGAHVAGFVGKYLQDINLGNLPWIIGLDPAGPGFQFNRCENRLCEYDADIVEVFHTSIGTGSLMAFGDIDFYFNGGVTQPGCSIIDVSCSHGKAVEYFSETISNERQFCGKKWRRINLHPPTFKNCTEETCSVPGLLALELPARGIFWVDVPSNSTTASLDAEC